MTTKNYDYTPAFQDKIAAMLLRDQLFAESTHGLVLPEYFENKYAGKLVALALDYFAIYRTVPSVSTLGELIKKALSEHKLRQDEVQELGQTLRTLYAADISDRDYTVDEVTTFARHRATEEAILKSVDLLNTGKIDEIETLLKDALNVGSELSEEYDYFEEVVSRTERRKAEEAGAIGPSGITTGSVEIDQRLYHKGFGRQELSLFMGPAKIGKSWALLHSAISAVISSHNVLYVTLENSREVTADRFDAYLSNVLMDQLKGNADLVAERINAHHQQGKMGQLKIRSYPTGTFRPKDLRRVLKHYAQKGTQFDEIVIDYLDIMAPDFRYKEMRDNSKNIYESVRGIAEEENVAIVSATQTNREGFGASVADSTHVAEDINKIRTADLVISINRNEEERSKKQARLYMAAGRNQEDGLTIFINQDLSRAKFITSVMQVV